MPSNRAAWITEAKANPFVVKEAPYSAPEADEVVIKNAAVAANPVDWKLQDYASFPIPYPNIFGEDSAGVVEEVGSNVTKVKKGDRVHAHACGLMTGQTKHASYQEYQVAHQHLVHAIPASMSFEEACVLPLCIDTAAAGLYEKDKLGLPYPSTSPSSQGQVVFVWGGSSAVGICAVMLAVASGFEVFTTASKRNHDLLKSVGASQVFDYNDSNVVDEVAGALKGKTLAGSYDAISEEQTIKTTSAIISASTGEKNLAVVLPGSSKNAPEGILVKEVFGLTPMNNELGPMLSAFMPEALEKGIIKAKPEPLVVGKGLESIQAAVDANKKGLSAKKAVVTL